MFVIEPHKGSSRRMTITTWCGTKEEGLAVCQTQGCSSRSVGASPALLLARLDAETISIARETQQRNISIPLSICFLHRKGTRAPLQRSFQLPQGIQTVWYKVVVSVRCIGNPVLRQESLRVAPELKSAYRPWLYKQFIMMGQGFNSQLWIPCSPYVKWCWWEGIGE